MNKIFLFKKYMMILSMILFSQLSFAKMQPCHIQVELEATPGFTMQVTSEEIIEKKQTPAKSCPLPKKGEDPKKLCASQKHGSTLTLQNGQVLYVITSLSEIEDQLRICQKSM